MLPTIRRNRVFIHQCDWNEPFLTQCHIVFFFWIVANWFVSYNFTISDSQRTICIIIYEIECFFMNVTKMNNLEKLDKSDFFSSTVTNWIFYNFTIYIDLFSRNGPSLLFPTSRRNRVVQFDWADYLVFCINPIERKRSKQFAKVKFFFHTHTERKGFQ